MPHVLITKIGGGVDYATDGQTDVVLVDFDELDGVFPDRLDQLIAQVTAMPRTMPWRTDILSQLKARRLGAVQALLDEHLALDLHPEILGDT